MGGGGRRAVDVADEAGGGMSGLMLDAGALIAVDRGDRRMIALLEAARDARAPISTTAPVIAQAWRNGRTQARLAAFLKQPVLEVVPFGVANARAVGELSGLARIPDVVDVHVVLSARSRDQSIVTSDVGDLSRIDPRADLIEV